jgi:MerR HTH family regulatory protein
MGGSLSGTARTQQVGRVNQETRELTAEQAAGLLGVSSEVLLRWEHRFDYPCTRSSDGERIYVYGHIAALREALTSELSVASAIRTAQHLLNQSCDAGTARPVGRRSESLREP